MKKFINNVNVEEVIENKRAERGMTYEYIAKQLGYTKAGIRQMIKSNNIRVSQLELLSDILNTNFFLELSLQYTKGQSSESNKRPSIKDVSNKKKAEEYQEKYITCLEERANITTKLQEATLYINRCEMLLLKNDIPLPIR